MTDSQLVVSQINGEYEAKDESMEKYSAIVRTLISIFKEVEFVQLPRSHNHLANALTKLGNSSLTNLNRSVMVEVRPFKAIVKKLSRYIRHNC